MKAIIIISILIGALFVAGAAFLAVFLYKKFTDEINRASDAAYEEGTRHGQLIFERNASSLVERRVSERLLDWKQGQFIQKVFLFPPDYKDEKQRGYTVVRFGDGEATYVRLMEGEEYDPVKGIMYCVMKKVYGNSFKRYIKQIMNGYPWGEDCPEDIAKLLEEDNYPPPNADVNEACDKADDEVIPVSGEKATWFKDKNGLGYCFKTFKRPESGVALRNVRRAVVQVLDEYWEHKKDTGGNDDFNIVVRVNPQEGMNTIFGNYWKETYSVGIKPIVDSLKDLIPGIANTDNWAVKKTDEIIEPAKAAVQDPLTDKVRVFISQPMKDKTNEEIEAEREELIAFAKEKVGDDIEIIDSFMKNAPHDSKPLWYLARSIRMLSGANVAIFAKGWEKARGCRIEHQCAVDYDIEVFEA